MKNNNQKTTLHLVQNKISISDFERQLSRLVNIHDQIIFIGDAVFSIKSLRNSCDNLSIYAIEEDLINRSIAHKTGSVKTINFEQFVELTIRSDKNISW